MPPHVLAALEGKDIAVGVVDVASDTVELPADVRATLELAAKYVARDRTIA